MVFAPNSFQTLEAEQRYQEMHVRVSQFQDNLGGEVDEGIFETVVMLNLAGFTTHQSCEGHLDHGLPYPWVTVIDVEQDRLFTRQWLEVCELEEQAKEAGTQEAYDRWLATDVQLRLIIVRCEQDSTLHQRLTDLLDTFYAHASTPGPVRLVVKRFRSTATYRIEPGFAALAEELPASFKADYLERGQMEMQAFTAFLKQRIFEQKEKRSA